MSANEPRRASGAPAYDTLEDRLDEAFFESDVAPMIQGKVKAFLEVLRLKDKATYEHSLRVGMLSSRIAHYLHLDRRALLYAGLLHDIGKSLIPLDVLQKKHGFSEQDMAIMRDHPWYTHALLHGVFDFTSDIAARHHRYQPQGYPEVPPAYTHAYSTGTKALIDFFGRIVALADFYDALTTRHNERFVGEGNEGKELAPGAPKRILLDSNPDLKELVEELFRNEIFEDAPREMTPAQQARRAQMQMADASARDYTPRGVARTVALALALEPLSEKPGCTTHSRDVSRHLKLDYFIAGAINIADAFEDLAARVQDGVRNAGAQPALIYDLAARAQLECGRNRAGGRVNEGMIEMLVPIVAAQTAYDPHRQESADFVLDRAGDVLRDSSRADVEQLIETKRIANDLSGYVDRTVPLHPEAVKVQEYYVLDLDASSKPTSKKHNEEFVKGFPAIRRAYRLLEDLSDAHLNDRMRRAYDRLRMPGGLHEGVSPGLSADCCGVALYLYLSLHPDEIVVK